MANFELSLELKDRINSGSQIHQNSLNITLSIYYWIYGRSNY